MTAMDRQLLTKMSKELRDVAMEASLTGSLKKGSRILVGMYNRCVEALKAQNDSLVDQLFPTLPEGSTTIDEVGAAAALLYGYLRPARGGRRRDDEDEDDDADAEDEEDEH